MAVFTAISTAITAVSSWTIGLGALGSFAVGNFLLRSAVQLGVSALAKAFAKKDTGPDPFSIQGSVRTGGSVPRSFVMGPALSAGSLVWHTEWGTAGSTPNAYYTQVIALSDLPVAGLHRWFVEGRAVTLEDMGDEKGLAAVEYRENGTDHAWIRFHDGHQVAADTFLTGTVNEGAPRAYSSNRIGTGIAYAVVTFKVNQEIFTGFPRSKFVLNGVKLYDISKDSTAGGTGAQRWADPATWGGDGDALPAVQAYNLARGMSFGGEWFYGLQGLTAARLPAAHWVAQVQKCRATVTGEDGPEPMYRCAGEITVDSEIGSAFEAILTACAGRMSEIGGIFKIYVGAPDAPIASLTDQDIVSLAPQTFTPFHGLSKTVNGVIASYPSPGEGYVMRSTPPLYNADYEVEDGNRRLMTNVQLSFVPFPAQAQRLLTGELATARRARRHTFTLPAKFRRIEPGDVLEWTSARNGYAVKQFRVDGVIDLPNCDLIVDLTEVDPADHGDWDHSTDFVPVTPTPVLPVRPTAQGVIGFNPVAADVQDAAGTARRPALLMKWNVSVEDIAGLMFEVRLKATGAMVAGPETRAFYTGAMLVEAGLVASTHYEVRAKYIPASPRAVSWTSWVNVTTNDVRIGPDDLANEVTQSIADAQGKAVDAAAGAVQALQSAANVQSAHDDLTAGFTGRLKSAFAQRDEGISDARTAADSTGSALADLTAGFTGGTIEGAINAARSELSAEIGGVRTTLIQDYYTAASTNAAITAAKNTLQSNFNSVSATLTNDYYTSAKTDQAITSAKNTLQSSINGVSSTLSNDYYTSAKTDEAITAAKNTLQSNINGVSATLTNDYYTSAKTDEAVTAATSALSATFSASQGVLKTQYLANALGWRRWSAQGNLTKTPNELFSEGETWDFNVSATQKDGLALNTAYTTPGWIGQKNAEAYVVECDFTLISGTLDGAALYIAWYNDVPRAWASHKRFADCLTSPLVTGERMTARVLLKRPSGFTGTFDKHVFHAFANWNALPPMAAKNIKFHRVNIRVATPEELGTGILADTLNGEITDIKALDVNGNTAFGKLLDQLDVDAGGTSAVVTKHASAVADLEGFASAYAGVTVQTNGGRIAGFRATSFSNPDGSGSGVLELLGDVVAPGTLSTNALTVGLGQNLLSNTDFSDGMNGWVSYKTGGGGNVNFHRRGAGASWAGKYYPTLGCHQASGATDGYTDIKCHPKLVNGLSSKGAQVKPDEWVEVSVKASLHRCRFELRIQFYNASGNGVGYSGVLASANDVRSSSTNPDVWPTYWGKWKAPAGTAYATIHMRKLATNAGSSDSWLFAHKPQLARSHANATQPAPYSPGGTTLITGDKVATGSVNADRMNTASFAATGLALFGGTMKSTNFVSGTRGWRIDNTDQWNCKTLWRAIGCKLVRFLRASHIQTGLASRLVMAKLSRRQALGHLNLANSGKSQCAPGGVIGENSQPFTITRSTGLILLTLHTTNAASCRNSL